MFLPSTHILRRLFAVAWNRMVEMFGRSLPHGHTLHSLMSLNAFLIHFRKKDKKRNGGKVCGSHKDDKDCYKS